MQWFILIAGAGFMTIGGAGLFRAVRAGGRPGLESWANIALGIGVALQAVGFMRRLPSEDPAGALFFAGGICMLAGGALQWRAWQRRTSRR